jgi:hypothetical protein
MNATMAPPDAHELTLDEERKNGRQRPEQLALPSIDKRTATHRALDQRHDQARPLRPEDCQLVRDLQLGNEVTLKIDGLVIERAGRTAHDRDGYFEGSTLVTKVKVTGIAVPPAKASTGRPSTRTSPMAEGRMLRKKVSRDGRVAQLSAHSALLYLMSIPHLDVDGRMDGSPVAVRGTVVPALASAQPTDWTDDRASPRTSPNGRAHTTKTPACRGRSSCTTAPPASGSATSQASPRTRPTPGPRAAELVPRTAADAARAARTRTPTPGNLRSSPGLKQKQKFKIKNPQTSEVRRARERPSVAALQDQISQRNPGRIAAGILEGVARRKDALATHGPLGRLLEVLPDADENTPAVLHSVFDGLGLRRSSTRAARSSTSAPRKPSAYAVGIGRRLAGGDVSAGATARRWA